MAIPVGYEEVTATAASAIGLTAATITTLATNYPDLWVMVQNSPLTSYPAAYLFYGTPTAATFSQLAAGDTMKIKGVDLLRAFLAIGNGGSAKLAVHYFSGE